MGTERPPQRVLVRAPNWAGDLVMATPGFRALRHGLPDAHLVVSVRSGLVPLLAGAPWFDDVVPLTGHRQGVRAAVRDARRLREYGPFDLGLCVPDSFSSALLMRAVGVRRTVGYRRGGRGFLLHQPVSPSADWGRRRLVSRERFVLGLLEAAGIEPVPHGAGPCPEVALELFTTAEEEQQAESLFAAHGLASGDRVALLAPGASFGPSKLWPPTSFARVGDALARAGWRVGVVGAPTEAALGERVVGDMKDGGANWCGQTDLGTLKAVVRRAGVVICNDAGTRHIAVAFGVPCVVLMGPTSLEKTADNLHGVEVLAADVPCRPCYQRECPIDHRCMTRIDPESVAAAAVARAEGR
ncbi:MAG: lipopolysaccharide heptosyltransferase II [Proteobacteria bacterium]|nr:lipopolysaccharide heptosyltransferase II [Pseudomonadota bacterium]